MMVITKERKFRLIQQLSIVFIVCLIYQVCLIVGMVLPDRRVHPLSPELTKNPAKVLQTLNRDARLLKVGVGSDGDRLLVKNNFKPNAEVKLNFLNEKRNGLFDIKQDEDELSSSEDEFHKGLLDSDSEDNENDLKLLRNLKKIRIREKYNQSKRKQIGLINTLNSFQDGRNIIQAKRRFVPSTGSLTNKTEHSEYSDLNVDESSWEWTQIKLKTNIGRGFGFVTRPLRREKRALSGPIPKILEEMCLKVTNDSNHTPPLKCIQCRSNLNDKDPQCDARLFQYVRESDKLLLRTRCREEKGEYCIKTVKRKFGERITERGCFGKNIRGPDGKMWKSSSKKDVCFTYPLNGYDTTTCFCTNDLCNAAPRFNSNSGNGSIIPLMLICAGFALYGLTFLFKSEIVS